MVLMAGGNAESEVKEVEITPFKHWLNKHQPRLLKEYAEDPKSNDFEAFAKKEFDLKIVTQKKL